LRQVLRIEADPVDEMRPPAAQEVQSEGIESGRRGDAAVVKDLSRLIQNGDLEPGVVPPITGHVLNRLDDNSLTIASMAVSK
jgi:hypothetical protein